MLLNDVKIQVQDKRINRASVFRVPIKDKPSNGYEYKIVFENKSGDRDFLTRQRGGARTFSTLSAVENVFLKIDLRLYTVLMLEYQIAAGIIKQFIQESDGKTVLEEFILSSDSTASQHE